ncbi:MAG: dTDP-4-dehydrorhamnose reductase [Gemmatimonadota bacterium]
MNRPSIVITGAEGMLARALADVLRSHGAKVIALGKHVIDVTNHVAMREALLQLEPRVVIQCAGFTRVDDAETQEKRAFAVNADATANVAGVCRTIGARLLYPSTDYVFDGASNQPYPPDAATNPINAYGRSKVAGEHAAREAGDYLIVRTSWLYGPGGRNFVRGVANRLAAGEKLRIVRDQIGVPTWTFDLARTISALLTAGPTPGVYHAVATGSTSWYDVAREVAWLLRSDQMIESCTTDEYPTAAKRPRYSVLDCRATDALIGPARDWRDALNEAVAAGAF